MTPPKHASVARASSYYTDEWLWTDGYGYTRGWRHRFPEMILWYSVAGSAVLNEKAADTLAAVARAGEPLPRQRRATWQAAQFLAAEVCARQRTNPVDWFTGGCGDLEGGWRRLDAIPGIGPKIASFILRDLSLMRDYSRGEGLVAARYRNNMDRRWFDRLPVEDQALFMPIDVYVHDGARQHAASETCSREDVSRIQADPDLHRRAASEIVRWARIRGYDPRDLDIYWYLVGAEQIHIDGSPLE